MIPYILIIYICAAGNPPVCERATAHYPSETACQKALSANLIRLAPSPAMAQCLPDQGAQ